MQVSILRPFIINMIIILLFLKTVKITFIPQIQLPNGIWTVDYLKKTENKFAAAAMFQVMASIVLELVDVFISWSKPVLTIKPTVLKNRGYILYQYLKFCD